jgi:hypothetical protein
VKPSCLGLAPALLTSLLVLACGGGGGHGGSTPTSPTPQGNTIVVSAGFVATIGGGSLLEATLTLDGKQIDHGDWTATGGCGVCVMGAMVGSVSSGAHTVTLTVVRQTATVVSYAAQGSVSVASSASGQSIALPQKNVSLRAGESVSYQISF